MFRLDKREKRHYNQFKKFNKEDWYDKRRKKD